VARLEAELVERAGEEDEDYEKTDWRGVAQFDLDDSDGEPLYEDPRQHAWSGLPQDLREVPKHEAVEALRSHQNEPFCLRNGPVTGEKDGLHSQTQVFVLGVYM
jgi:hypothetical protein